MKQKKFVAFLLVLPVAVALIVVADLRRPAEDLREEGKDAESRAASTAGSVVITETDLASDPSADPQENQHEFETEIIFGQYEVLVNPNCDWKLLDVETKEGKTVKAVHCRPINKSQRQYEEYDDETLEVMAYDDAMAAWELSLRSVNSDPEKSIDYLIRTIALNPHQAQSSYWASQYFPLTDPNEETNRPNRMALYAFALLDEQFRDEGSSELQLNQLLQAGAMPEDVEKATALADRLIARVNSLRSEIGITNGGLQ